MAIEGVYFDAGSVDLDISFIESLTLTSSTGFAIPTFPGTCQASLPPARPLPPR